MVSHLTRHVDHAAAVASRIAARGSAPHKGKRLPWLPAEDMILRTEWFRHTLVKVIAFRLGRSITDVKRRRPILALPPRRREKRMRQVKINVDQSTFEAIGKRASSSSQVISDYLRTIIERDIQYRAGQ